METNIANAAMKKDWTTVRQLAERGDDVNVVTGWNRSGLHWAAYWGNRAICEYLLKKGANISATDEYGDQPLHSAASENEAAVCELLVAHGADVTAVNKEGQTPLIKAVGSSCRSRHSSVVCPRLITNGSVNVKGCDGDHALHIASRKSNVVTVQLLVYCGADTNAVNKHRQTPLHTAAGGEKDCPELCEILLKHNAEINAVDKDGSQPLHLACKRGHFEFILLLMSHGASVTTCNVQGYNAQQCFSGRTGSNCPELSLIVTSGFNVDATDASGNSCLHFACEAGLTLTVKALLDCSADV